MVTEKFTVDCFLPRLQGSSFPLVGCSAEIESLSKMS